MRMAAVFSKDERLRHIGHLDIMRAMQRALRRSGLPVSYSQGFNPHILLGFASALSTGAASERELMEVTLRGEVSAEEFLRRMNASLPPQMQLVRCFPLEEKGPALMSLVRAARWRVELLGEGAAAIAAAVPAFLQQEEIPSIRKTKSGEKEINLRPWIYSLSADGGTLHATLALSEQANCKPDMLVRALAAFAGTEAPRMLATREELMGEDPAGQLIPLEVLLSPCEDS